MTDVNGFRNGVTSVILRGCPPNRAHCVAARGPFDVDAEITLLQTHRIDTLVTKNSGGSATAAKLEAARRLGARVVMIDRPPSPAVATVDTVHAAIALLSSVRSLSA